MDNIFGVLSDILMLSGIESAFEAENPGLWVGDKKIAAVGIEVKNGVSTHGFALNVFPKFNGFELIVPCGITDRGVVYWSELADPPSLDKLARIFAKRFASAIGRKINWVSPEKFFEIRNLL